MERQQADLQLEDGNQLVDLQGQDQSIACGMLDAHVVRLTCAQECALQCWNTASASGHDSRHNVSPQGLAVPLEILTTGGCWWSRDGGWWSDGGGRWSSGGG